MKANFVKLAGGQLIPATEEDRELTNKIRAGEVVRLTYSRMRNYQFHKKYFALMNFAFERWEPAAVTDDREWLSKVTPEKNFTRFREDVTILAGFYDAHFRLDGTVRISAKSISFASMDSDEFEKLYSATINVILKHVCTQFSEDELNHMVDQTLMFA
jgi:hypothetical protein